MHTPRTFSIPLWPDSVAGSTLNDDFIPQLDCYLLDSPSPAPAVLICPGGGYYLRAHHEGEPIAHRFNAAGFHAFVCHYRTHPHRHPEPLMDLSRAIRLIRHHSRAWGVVSHQIAVAGFSAGGHLAATLAVNHHLAPREQTALPLNHISNRPDASILCYPVITAFPPHCHSGSYEALLGERLDDVALRTQLSPEHQVNDHTPPTFLWHTSEDATVPCQNSLLYAAALVDHKVPCELHLYRGGRHGMGLAQDGGSIGSWSELACSWLRELGWGEVEG
jgi:acetyl esterase/lipase